jgi:hypothetical protein
MKGSPNKVNLFGLTCIAMRDPWIKNKFMSTYGCVFN